ncbi:transaldolase [Nostocales cyanobacterium HT-58-2]|nr:transaldolase [Nostocales cyanobacterium HT-58-2]
MYQSIKDSPSLKHESQSIYLPENFATKVEEVLEDWQKNQKVQRLWNKDASLWTNTDEAEWLGWLEITQKQLANLDRLQKFAQEVKELECCYSLLMGMGGSSLCPEVLSMTFNRAPGHPELHILDSTDPDQIQSIADTIEPTLTLFTVSSKSGTTLETNLFKQYFFEIAQQAMGSEFAGNHFIAITDQNSPLERIAKRDRFRRIFFGVPSIGGRYSALSDFGMVPAAVIGIDLAKFLHQTQAMVETCANFIPQDNPGVVLGAVLGVLANEGRDKVTFIISPSISGLGAWLEQLLAESTGKQGKGIIPVDLEPFGTPEVYGSVKAERLLVRDRLFVYIRLESAPDPAQDRDVEALKQAGHLIVRIQVADPYHLGQEFFRWQMATAVAGSIIGINPFDQPDVEASKVVTKQLIAEYEKTGSVPSEKPIFEEGNIRLFADEKNATALEEAVGASKSLVNYLRAHLNRLHPGDYFALLAFIERNEPHQAQLQLIRQAVRDFKRVATCLGFGPRYLHSTGQAYKGGPNTGVFLQITCDDAIDLPIPGQKYTFGVVKAAQARADFQVLAQRNRRALRVHLGANVTADLAVLGAAIQEALR